MNVFVENSYPFVSEQRKTASGADLGGSSKYSNENFEDRLWSLSDFEKFLQQHQLNEGSHFDLEKVLQRRGAFLDLEAKFFFSKAVL